MVPMNAYAGGSSTCGVMFVESLIVLAIAVAVGAARLPIILSFDYNPHLIFVEAQLANSA